MVTNRAVLEDIQVKITNLLKHLPCRQLKLKSIEWLTSELDTNIFGVKIVIQTPDSDIENVTLFKKKDLKDSKLPKHCIEQILKKIPQQYLSITIQDVQVTTKGVLKNFKEKDIPDEFILEKFPYRQLQIRVNDRKLFIKLSTKTYQKILNFFNKQNQFPLTISFSHINNCLKRRELVTLLLYLTQTTKE